MENPKPANIQVDKMNNTHPILLVLLFLFFSLGMVVGQGTVIFVAQGANGSNDGTSWTDAFSSLQDALAVTSEGDTLWVSEGIYTPGLPGTASTVTFLLAQNICLYGGFAGTETVLNERDPATHVTILSGDLNGDDLPGDLDSNRSDNAITVLIVADSLTNATVIDGFTVEGGHATGGDAEFFYRRGGGMFLFGAPTISNCIFTENYANAEGGAVYFQGPFAEGTQVENCVFDNNRAGGDGGAFMASYCLGVGISINGCIFSNNTASEQGGAVKLFNTTCQFDQTTFSGNTGRMSGGAIDSRGSFDNVSVVLANCIFKQNRSRFGAALRYNPQGILSVYSNSLQISGCTFEQNEALLIDSTVNGSPQGGALHIVLSQGSNDAKATIENCVFGENTSTRHGAAIRAELDGQNFLFTLVNCEFTGNSAGREGTVYATSSKLAKGTLDVGDCTWESNTSDGEGAGLSLQTREGADIQYLLTNCEFLNNTTTASGGAMATNCLDFSAMHIWVDGGTFSANSALGQGGAVFSSIASDGYEASFSHCRFEANESTKGAAFTVMPANGQLGEGSSLFIDNSLFSGNVATDAVIIANSFSGLALVNCTVAGNTAGSLALDSASAAVLQNNIFFNPGYQEFAGQSGTAVTSPGGNVVGDGSLDGMLSALDKTSADPLFAGAGDFELTSGSPAIDQGVSPDNPPAFDLAGNDRVQGGKIDAGAFESPFVSATAPVLPPGGGMTIVPNPVGAVTTLRLENEWRGSLKLRLFNTSGQVAAATYLEKQSDAASWELNLEGLPSGAYTVVISFGNRILQKVIIKKEH